MFRNTTRRFLLRKICLIIEVNSITRPVHFSCGSRKQYQVNDLFRKWKRKFTEANIPEPVSSIQHIIAFHLRSTNVVDVEFNSKSLTLKEKEEIEAMCKQRLDRVPVQYIIGEWDFRQLTLKMRPPVFIPRVETEMLVDLVLKEVDAKNVKHVLEICCGSGAIGLSLLHERPGLEVTAVDQSEEACELTKENAQRYQLCKRLCVVQSKVSQGNPLNFLGEKLKVIVSNPPYVPRRDIERLDPEILLYEDLQALDGGESGLDVIKLILHSSARLLLPGGKLFLEVDASHPKMIRDWLTRNAQLGLEVAGVHEDFGGKERFVEIMRQT